MYNINYLKLLYNKIKSTNIIILFTGLLIKKFILLLISTHNKNFKNILCGWNDYQSFKKNPLLEKLTLYSGLP